MQTPNDKRKREGENANSQAHKNLFALSVSIRLGALLWARLRHRANVCARHLLTSEPNPSDAICTRKKPHFVCVSSRNLPNVLSEPASTTKQAQRAATKSHCCRRKLLSPPSQSIACTTNCFGIASIDLLDDDDDGNKFQAAKIQESRAGNRRRRMERPL